MYRVYFRRRFKEALASAENAMTEQERLVHLRTSNYYRDLLEASAGRV